VTLGYHTAIVVSYG